MSTNFLHHTRRTVLTLIVAALVMLSATYAPILLDTMAGTSLTSAVYACQHPGGSCG